MTTKQETVENELKSGNSIAWWCIGFYKSVGNVRIPSIDVPIFDIKDEEQPVVKVLIEYFGSMMWISVRRERVFYGIKDNARMIGVNKRLVLEIIENRN